MYKSIITIALLFSGTVAHAHSSECNFSTDYNIEVKGDSLTFSRAAGDHFEFIGDRLLINDKPVTLTSSQLTASHALQQNTRKMMTNVAEIAIEGAELGIKAVTVVANALFMDDQQMQKELITPVESLTGKIKANISVTQFNAEGLKLSLDESVEKEFETAIELAMSKYAGKMAGNLLSKIFSGDSEELNDFEFRMENLEQEIETYVEANAKELEAKADALCDDLLVLEANDSALSGVAGYPQEGLFYQGRNDGVRIGGTTISL